LLTAMDGSPRLLLAVRSLLCNEHEEEADSSLLQQQVHRVVARGTGRFPAVNVIDPAVSLGPWWSTSLCVRRSANRRKVK